LVAVEFRAELILDLGETVRLEILKVRILVVKDVFGIDVQIRVAVLRHVTRIVIVTSNQLLRVLLPRHAQIIAAIFARRHDQGKVHLILAAFHDALFPWP